MAIQWSFIMSEVARLLLQNKALEFSLKNPFLYASGMKGPVYCDNRRLLSFVEDRRFLIGQLKDKIQQTKIPFDKIAGLATAGIPYGVLVAEAMGYPFIYIRKEAKGHGKKRQIEGVWKKGDRIILIEDLVNQGSGVLQMAAAARNEGLIIDACFCIVDYEMERTHELLRQDNLKLYSLASLPTILKTAEKLNKITTHEHQAIMSWHKKPSSFEYS